jgi:hypothetical protein
LFLQRIDVKRGQENNEIFYLKKTQKIRIFSFQKANFNSSMKFLFIFDFEIDFLSD